MNRELYRYNFDSKVPIQDVEESLLLAVLAAESLHGRSLVRLDASFCLDSKKRSCVVDAVLSPEVVNNVLDQFAAVFAKKGGRKKQQRNKNRYPLPNAAFLYRLAQLIVSFFV